MKDDDLLSIAELSVLLQVPVGTLYQWRSRKRGPASMKLGRHIRYRGIDVRMWLEEQAAKSQ